MYAELYHHLKNKVTGKADVAFQSGKQQLMFSPGYIVTKWKKHI